MSPNIATCVERKASLIASRETVRKDWPRPPFRRWMQHCTGGTALRTELRHEGASVVEFVVHTREGLYQDRLVKMGWRPLGQEAFTRRLTASPT